MGRHPGRRLDASIAPAHDPYGIVLDFHITENKPWTVYGNVSNTGTAQTNMWRYRVGAFVSQLTKYTDMDGDVSLSKDATHIYGPYLRKAEVPLEPMTNSTALKIETTGALGMTAEVADPGGWRFDNVTGQLIVNHSSWETR